MRVSILRESVRVSLCVKLGRVKGRLCRRKGKDDSVSSRES